MSRNELALLVGIFRAADKSGVNIEGDDFKYVKTHKREIRRVGRGLRFLRLAKRDVNTDFGWRPTRRLYKLIAERTGRWSKRSSSRFRTLHEAITVGQVVGHAFKETTQLVSSERQRDIDNFIWNLLENLGLIGRDLEGQAIPTPLMKRLLLEVDISLLEDR